MTSRYRIMLLLVVLPVIATSVPVGAQDQYIGEIRYVAFNFAPKGWALCNGQLLPIAQNAALYNLLGTTFGGDGQTTFALPNMQGRVPVATGNGAGLSPRVLGEQGGQESVALTLAQMPAHRHTLNVSSGTGNSKGPTGNVLAGSASGAIYTNSAPNAALQADAMNIRGQSQPHENMQPFLAMTCIIALQGIYPTQN